MISAHQVRMIDHAARPQGARETIQASSVNSARNRQLTTIAVCVLLWVLICGVLLAMLWPWRPTTALQWLLFILVGPPI